MIELELLGQEIPRKLLLNAYSGNNIAHSYLFMGPPGTGKFSLALWFSTLINCRAPVNAAHPAPCGQCPSCKKMRLSVETGQLNHPDVRIIYPDPQTYNIKIEQIRAIQKEAYYLPLESQWKIYIINGAHRMLDSAASCFLKILEEPPSRVINILCSNSLYTLLPTIISRCQLIKFTPVEAHLLADFITRKEEIPPERSLVYASIAQGSVGKALELCRKEGLWELRRKVLDMLHTLPSIAVSDILLLADRFSRDREEVELAIEFILNWLRDLIFVKEHAEPESLINVDRIEQLENQALQLTLWQIINCISYAKEAQVQLKSQVNTGFVLSRLFMGINKIETAMEN